MPARYLIDGYNLAHAAGDLFGKVGPHGLERARKALVTRLAKGHAESPGDVSIAFDARHARSDKSREEIVQGIHVLFAIREEADDLIERMLRTDSAPKQLAVVSSDRRIKEAARRRGCTVMTSDEYLDWLEKPRSAPVIPPTSEKPDTVVVENEAQLLAAFEKPKPRRRGPE